MGLRTTSCREPNELHGGQEVEKDGAKIFVEPKALMHVIGTTMDFVEDDLSSEFVFHNPNAEASCGCGESFTVGKK